MLTLSSNDAASEVFFEILEASPCSADVIASENALKWEFPGSTVAIPYSTFVNESFQESMATFLERASSESVSQFASTTAKAGSRVVESRDTVNPALVSQFLTTVLEVVGRRVDQPTFCKRIRDDVTWAPGSELPWRRCPFWLVLRVGVQIRLQNVHGLDIGRFRYKLLITVVVAQLLLDATGVLDPGRIASLKAKLGRRLAKLAILHERISNDPNNAHNDGHVLEAMGKFFEKTMERSSKQIDSEWSTIKRQSQRQIRRLPSQADDKDMVLSLPSSGPYLDSVMGWEGQLSDIYQVSHSVHVPKGYNQYGSNSNPMGEFTARYFHLAQFEERLTTRYRQQLDSMHVQDVATDINEYLRLVGTTYDSDPQQKSTMMLHLMRMWCQMDEIVTDTYPMILEYGSGIPLGVFNVLHVTHLADLKTLQLVESYLQWRHDRCGHIKRTIFEGPSRECFAVRYFEKSPNGSNLRTLLSTLEAAAERDRSAKEREWNRVIAEAKHLEDGIAAATCLLTTTSDENEHFRSCHRCFLKRKRRRMKIDIFEHPVPSDDLQKKALVFELDPPSEFRVYRDTTRAVLHLLERDGQEKQSKSPMLLSASTFLKPYLKTPSRVCLASNTKPFEKTHYRTLKLPVSLEEVCRPCGLNLTYFDAKEGLWIAPRGAVSTVAHHLLLPAPLRTLLSPSGNGNLEPNPANSEFKSSYDVMAKQLFCPTGWNIHEFISLNQTFAAGDEQRWFNILIELGASNLNFSTEPIRIMVDTLSSRAGRAARTDVLRTAYCVFRDVSFRDRLAQLVRQKLDSISSNWHETNCMDVLITLILHLCAWSSEPNKCSRAEELLQALRDTTHHWVMVLLEEIQTSTDVETGRRLARYVFTAALLYRKTFSALWAAHQEHPQHLIGSQELSRWIEVSIAFRDHMPTEPDTLPVILRNALVSIQC